ncbi:hypothetical protein P608_18185 [Comamonas thiooxydans]|uniref:Uncharacterized protein n=1 Tax=Comamonas thiooxydans TaxID=363952 RepID=A0A0E3CEH2_9BURK|nr:hypothetical protein P608_18185 [Comamonas thiooxydans]KGH10867.1 hypothetical protein P607_25750 [Comamonas thiooxydans]
MRVVLSGHLACLCEASTHRFTNWFLSAKKHEGMANAGNFNSVAGGIEMAEMAGQVVLPSHKFWIRDQVMASAVSRLHAQPAAPVRHLYEKDRAKWINPWPGRQCIAQSLPNDQLWCHGSWGRPGRWRVGRASFCSKCLGHGQCLQSLTGQLGFVFIFQACKKLVGIADQDLALFLSQLSAIARRYGIGRLAQVDTSSIAILGNACRPNELDVTSIVHHVDALVDRVIAVGEHAANPVLLIDRDDG